MVAVPRARSGADAVRSAAVPWMCADIRRGARLFGWAPDHTLADSLAALWREVGGPGDRAVPELVPHSSI
jgi:hypothetical protein